jgi:integrase
MLFDQNGARKYLTTSERAAFIEAARNAPPKVETFCLTLAYTGARISEVLALTPPRIDLSAQAIIIETLKRRRRGIFRAVPIPVNLITRLDAVHKIAALRGNPTESELRLWPWGRTTAWERLKEVMRVAQVPSSAAMPKALRHAFGVSGVAEAGVPLNMIQKWLGHAKIETTAIYATAIGAEERTIASRMWQAIRRHSPGEEP